MYGGPITIDLTYKGEKQYNFPSCNRLWLAKLFCASNGSVQSNPLDAVLGIKIGSRDAQMHPWAIQDGFVTSASGAMDTIFVTVLTKGAANSLALMTGTNVGVGYGNTDGLSATVYSGSGDGDTLSTRAKGGFGGQA